MVDDRDDSPEYSRDDTIRQAGPAGQGGQGIDAGSAATMIAPGTPLPLPPAPAPGGTARPSAPTMARSPRALRESAQPFTSGSSRYVMGPVLGQGGMGEVLLATDEHIGREVAVKRIRASDPTPEERARFVREARVQGRLEHPAVVPVHDLAVDRDGRPFFVMKRLSGTEMSELLKQLREGAIPDEVACRRRLLRAFADVCLAVEFAHSRGIIHRDLKPANVMLGDFGEIYVLDWGVARAVTEPDDTGAALSGQHDLRLDSGDTRAGTILGTPAYMAPEQLVGDRVGPAADIYALGCILFEIACGEPLHPRSRSAEQALQAIDARPSQRRPDSPPELDAICDRAIRIDPAARYGSARALGAAVQSYLDGDRDLAVRAELARQHLAEARRALARGDDEVHRRDAMRAAGHALALDPTASEAADLVTHLMLRPPRVVPQEVEHRLDALDTTTARSQGRLAALALVGYLGFVPLLLWTGVREVLPIVAFAGIAIVSATQVYAMTRRARISPVGIYAAACINAVLIALVCRMVGPFIIAPTLVTTTLMVYAAHTQFGRIRIIAAILT
ncbi:MAG: serine/threonine-protein kinase, partial [Kofleriaceae bacterium]